MSKSEEPDEQGPCTGARNILTTTTKLVFAAGFLYIFFVSLSLLSDGFIVVGGAGLNTILKEVQDLLNNPFCGLIIGILITVFVQSSSTSTSIFITMAGSKLITVSQGIFMVMGANVGTSITSTLVAFGNSAEKEEFARAMSSAVVLAAFNWLTVFVLLPVETIVRSATGGPHLEGEDGGEGFLEWLTALCTQGLSDDSEGGDDLDFFSKVTGPLHDVMIKVNKGALGDENFVGTFVAYCAKTVEVCSNTCNFPECDEDTECYLWTPKSGETCEMSDQNGDLMGPEDTFYYKYGKSCVESNFHMFMDACWSDYAVGGTTLAVALIMMFVSLGAIVKLLKSVLEGSIAKGISKYIDKDLPGCLAPLTPYLYVLAGIGLTISVQSSSIILAILTPLCGLGMISLERAYPVTVGCDIGTTFTGLIAAFASPGAGFQRSMQVSLSHLFFNVIGACLWFVVPIMRQIPIGVARFAGRRTALYRWWAVNYIIGFFFVLPILAFVISIFSEAALVAILCIVLGVLLFVVIINAVRTTDCGQHCLPSFLKSWKWLPAWMRSLAPYDYFCSCVWCPCKSCKNQVADELSLSDVISAEPSRKSSLSDSADL